MYDPSMAETKYLRVQEAAAVAGVHVSTINRWFAEGRLTRHKIRNRFVRVDAAQLRQLTTPVRQP